MGLFTQGPQHRKDDWAGLPSEPYEPEGIEVPGAAPAADPTNLGLADLAEAGEVTTIDIPLPPAPEASGPEQPEPEQSEPEAD